MEIQIALGDRLRVAGRAFRALFKQPTSRDILGVYAGLFPGGPGSPPPRGIAELIKSYGDMPWVNAVVGKIASGIACAQWRVYVVRSKTGDVKWRKDLQRADFDTRQRLFKLMKRDRELEEVLDHPLPQVLEASNSFALGKLQIGLNKQQEKALAAFQAKLADEGASNIEERVAKYAKALERKRSLMIARTETLNASNGGQQTLWLEAKDAGYLDPNNVNRQWLVTDDDRLDVNICEPMDGQEVGLEESFHTGDGRSVMHPTAHPDCRCSMRLRFKK